MDVEDNAVVDPRRRASRPLDDVPLELDRVEEPVLARDLLPIGKLQVDGLAGSYGAAAAHHLRDEARAGPAGRRGAEFPPDDESWRLEWQAFQRRDPAGDGRPLAGDLESAAYGWRCIEAAYAAPGSEGPVSERALLSIVIPTYNEEANVPRVYERLDAVLGQLDVDAEIIFCVDPSTDRTEHADPRAQRT